MITIREIRETDVLAFREALDSVCRERKYLAAMEAPPQDRVRTFVLSNIAADFPQFVAEDNGRIVGWCDTIPGDASSGTAHVGQLGMGVIKDYRGQKLGRRLLEATIEKARKIGLEKIELSVYSENSSAIALYQKFGFGMEGRKRRGRFADGAYEDVLLMSLDLGAEQVILNILYQDDAIVAVDKPAGQMVIPSDSPQPDDEVTMKILRDQIGKRVHPIHRLDRPTSGVLIFSTDQDVARELHFAFEQHRIKKKYLAIIVGHPLRESWTCNEPIQKKEGAPLREAHTDFHLRQKLKNDLSLVEAIPRTGRFHQIRRHLLHLGHPIVGDYRYAGVERCNFLGEQLGTGTRMLLQAKSLCFKHPITGLEILIEAPLDPMIEKCL
jgi:tRNA pseudouridine65 synthase